MSTNKSIFGDVIVIGGGLAGVCAAIAAAREMKRNNQSSSVILIHDRPVLGGVSSSEIRVPPIGAGRNPWGFETGIISELMYEERKRNHNRWEMGTANSIWDIILWEKVKAESNLLLLLNTSVRKVTTKIIDQKKIVESISAVQLGNEHEYHISGKIFIDCSGDSVVGFESGAEIISGREAKTSYQESLALDVADDACMGSTLLFQAKDMGKPCPFIAPDYAVKYHDEKSLFYRPHSNFKNGYYWIEVGVPFKTIDQNEEIRDELIKHVLGVWDHLKNHCTNFGKEIENWALDWVGMIPGKRGSRRLKGDYVLNENDLRAMKLFDDRVGFGGHFFDLHTIGGILANDKPGNPVDIDPDLWDRCRLKPYPIPFSTLYSRNIDNLMMAGRNISTSHIANGSTRVMLTNALLGQAVGVASSICVSKNMSPRQVRNFEIQDLQQKLLRQGSTLHGIKNLDNQDQAKTAVITASNQLPLNLNPIENETSQWQTYRHSFENNLGCVIPISESEIKEISLWIESEEENATEMTISLFYLDCLWSIQNQNEKVFSVSKKILNHKQGYFTFECNAQVKPNKFYFLTVSCHSKKIFWRFRRNHPTGVFSVFQSPTSGFWKYLRHQRVEGFETFCLKISPTQYPFQPQNLVSGETRPFHFTNIYRASHDDRNHTWVKLDWQNKITMNEVIITFDTDLSLTNETMPEFYSSPQCVKDYSIEIFGDNGNLEHKVTIFDNYQRQRIHQLPNIKGKTLKLTVLKTNGGKEFGIYEIRVY